MDNIQKMEKLKIEFEKIESNQDYVNDKNDLEILNEENPKIASACPFRVHLEKDKDYFYCTCGLSLLQPFCDNSHIGTKYKPLKFRIKKDIKWQLLCGCKRNDITSGPFCDGRHVDIEWKDLNFEKSFQKF